jgi:hypothetical protein
LLRRLYLSFAVIHLLLSANPKGQHGESRRASVVNRPRDASIEATDGEPFKRPLTPFSPRLPRGLAKLKTLAAFLHKSASQPR